MKTTSHYLCQIWPNRLTLASSESDLLAYKRDKRER